MDILVSILHESWSVLGDMAPYLFLGFVVAGLLSVLVSPEWTLRHLGGRGMRPVVEAAMWGVPLPLCSCGVIPVAASMRRHGASRGATTAFLISTPETGVDSIAASYALLGPVFAVFRPLVALVGGVFAGGMVALFDRRQATETAQAEPPVPCQAACCGEKQRHPLWRAARYGLVTLPRDLAGPLLVGVVVAGAIGALVPPGKLEAWLGGGLLSIVLMMAVGLPIYVCATASVPIAAGLIYAGASPGAALAFLITGPATNAATFTTVWRILGRRAAIIYLSTVAASAILAGLALDGVFHLYPDWLPVVYHHTEVQEAEGWVSSAWATALLAVLLGPRLAALTSHLRLHATTRHIHS